MVAQQLLIKKIKNLAALEIFYAYVKNKAKNTTTKSSRKNSKEIRGPVYDEYSGINNDSRYITTIDSCHGYTKIFNSDKVYVNKRVYINNTRKYKNFKLLNDYNKCDYYEYLSDSLDNIFKTNS
jgi:hypothetical protein